MIDKPLPEYLVETELPNGDLLIMTPYAEPFREPGWLETIVRPGGERPTPIWARVMTQQGDRDYGGIAEAMTVLDADERMRYAARMPQLRERN